MLKLSARKLHITLSLNHFLSREMFFFGQLRLGVFLPPKVWAGRCQPPTGKSAADGGYVTRPGTVAAVCLGPMKCLDVTYNHTNIPCSVLSVCNNVLW